MVLILLLSASNNAESAIRYNGYLGAQEQDNGHILQNSNQKLSVDAAQVLSDKLETDENILLTSDWQQGYGAVSGMRRDAISPSMGLLLKNNLFVVGVSGSATRSLRDSGVVRLYDTDAVELNIKSSWEKLFVPNITFDAEQHNSYDTLSPHLRDQETLNANSVLDWDFSLFKVYYAYRLEKTTDNVSNIEDRIDGQTASVSAVRSFLDDRLKVDFSQSHSEEKTDREFGSNSTGMVRQTINQAFAGIDATPNDGDDSALNNAPALFDNLAALAYNATASQNDHNIVLRVAGNEVQYIYLYTSADLGTNWTGLYDPSAIPPNNIRLYTNSLFNVAGANWTDESTNIASVNYNSTDRRYEITLTTPIARNYLKINFNNILLSDVQITEAEVYIKAAAANTTTSTRLKRDSTSLGMLYRVNRKFQMHLSLNRWADEDTNGLQTKTIGESLVLSYNNRLSGLDSSVNFSNYQIDQELMVSTTKRVSRSYGFNIGKTFLPTLHGGINGNRTENYLAGTRTTETNRYGFSLDARLYPDLDSQINGTYSSTKQPSSSSETKNFIGDFSLTSRLKPGLSLSLAEKYTDFKTGINARESYRTSLRWNWQASDVLSYNGSIYQEDKNYEKTTIAFSSSIALAVGYKMQLELNYNAADQYVLSQSGSGTWRWTLGKNLFWVTGANYSQTEGVSANHVKLFSSISARYSLP